jgi:hypothetical protein
MSHLQHLLNGLINLILEFLRMSLGVVITCFSPSSNSIIFSNPLSSGLPRGICPKNRSFFLSSF